MQYVIIYVIAVVTFWFLLDSIHAALEANMRRRDEEAQAEWQRFVAGWQQAEREQRVGRIYGCQWQNWRDQ
jgi:hypothetical protein